jgi:histidyl-tRNA synthetase
LREHWQLNVDIFGVAGIGAELEMVMIVDDIFRNFGAKKDMYEIRLNHRGLIDYLLKDYLGLAAEAQHAVGKLIDRLHKMERQKFIAAVDDVLTPAQRENSTTEKLLAILDARKVADLPPEARGQDAAQELEALLAQLKDAGITNARFDGTLMRGFDYYTGIVFETYDTDPGNNRSMMGGGRYDGLVGLFGVQSVPTVGFGWGDVTLANFLETHRLIPALRPETDVYAVLIGDVAEAAQQPLAELRGAGLNVAVDLSGRKPGDQFKAADKKGIGFALVIGENELHSGQFSLKDLATGEEAAADIKTIIKKLKAN